MSLDAYLNEDTSAGIDALEDIANALGVYTWELLWDRSTPEPDHRIDECYRRLGEALKRST